MTHNLGSLSWISKRASGAAFSAPRLSPNGQRIAYSTVGKEWQIWVYDIGTGTNTRLTGDGLAGNPIWSPDGKRIAFQWTKSLQGNLFWRPYDASAPMERLSTSTRNQYPSSWVREPEMIAFVESHPGTSYDIVLLDPVSGKVSMFLNSNFSERYPDLSPDGRWIAYTSDESKRAEIYVRPVFAKAGSKSVRGIIVEDGYR
jgi:Tol biopolymer transport system component